MIFCTVSERHQGLVTKRRQYNACPIYALSSYVGDIICVALFCCARYIFHRRVWYHAVSLHYVCIRRSGIILTP